MAPGGGGDRPAERLFSENGAIQLWGFLAGRKVYLELCSKRELALQTEGPVATAVSHFLPSGVGAGRASCSFTTCLVSREVPQNLFFNFL